MQPVINIYIGTDTKTRLKQTIIKSRVKQNSRVKKRVKESDKVISLLEHFKKRLDGMSQPIGGSV